ncbi:unnamed protein product [Rodentolepis nana]|uniref:Leukocyte surface antigen CD53-like n=1 Tax=Rodentolepis nana TaxID=102285 RepID=A0A0R3T839_RODNA|nr:unnamed protein product [Rodentolepis nana]
MNICKHSVVACTTSNKQQSGNEIVFAHLLYVNYQVVGRSLGLSNQLRLADRSGTIKDREYGDLNIPHFSTQLSYQKKPIIMTINYLNIRYVLALLAILLFTCLGVGLSVGECGCIFSTHCRANDYIYVQMTGLMATSLCLFMIAAAISIVAVFKCNKWMNVVNFIIILIGAILMLAALCIFFRDYHYWASLMGGIAMTLSFETAAFILMDLFTKEQVVSVTEIQMN